MKRSLEGEQGGDGRIAKFPSRGADSGGVEAAGVLDSRLLPDSEFVAQWDSVIVEASQKDRLLSQAILNFTLREKVNRANLPLHGLIVLHGPPGTGKTSLARGLAARTAEVIGKLGQFRYIEVEPHALAGAALGKSQRADADDVAWIKDALAKKSTRVKVREKSEVFEDGEEQSKQAATTEAAINMEAFLRP